jgi:four helix bundle protein
MGARTVEELICYQLALQLRKACMAITARPAFKDDRRFRDDFRAAARSASSNIAEGFRRRTHREFARYLEYSMSSIAETAHHANDARSCGYISLDEEANCLQLAKRSNTAVSRLRRYLLDNPDAPDG